MQEIYLKVYLWYCYKYVNNFNVLINLSKIKTTLIIVKECNVKRTIILCSRINIIKVSFKWTQYFIVHFNINESYFLLLFFLNYIWAVQAFIYQPMLLIKICKYLYVDATNTLKVKSNFDVKKARNNLIYMLMLRYIL